MTADTLIIGIDCSTTGSKAVVVDSNGHTLATGSSPLVTSSPHPGWHEQDAGQWWPATDRAVRSALAEIDRPERVAAVCITHQRESFVCVDSDNRPLHPALLWLDARAGTEIERFGTPEIERLCGKPADITPALYKLAWIAAHRPEWLQAAHHVLDTHAFLVRELTGRWVTSRSSADPLALLDLQTRDYSPELLAIAGVERSQLPDLLDAGESIGVIRPEIALGWGVGSTVTLIAGLGDGQAAGVGAAVLDSRRAYLNAGTAILLGTECAGYAPSRSYRSLLSTQPGHTTLETFLSSGTYLPTWFRREFGDPAAGGEPDPQLEAAARLVPAGAEGLLTLPYWNAAQTPHWDIHASGAMVGWRGSHGRAHAYRSLLEGIAQELRLQLDGLSAATHTTVETIRAMGGGTRSALFSQILADSLGRPLEICSEPEVSALGAAVVAAAGIGLHPDLASASEAMTRSGSVVEPDPAGVETYARLRGLHAQLYPTLRGLMRELDTFVRTDDSPRTAPPIDPSASEHTESEPR